MNNSQTLLKLQTLRTMLLKTRNEIAVIASEINNDSISTEFSRVINGMSQGISDLENKFSVIDQEKSQLLQKIRLGEAKLYSGNVVSPKELIDIEKDIELNKKRIQVLEMEETNVLAQIESGGYRLSEQQDEFKAFGSDQITKRAELTFSLKNLKNKLVEMEAQIASLNQTLSPDLLSKFNELMDKKHGTAIALIRENCCTMCGSDITLNIRLAARSSETITNCPSCQRILIAEF